MYFSTNYYNRKITKFLADQKLIIYLENISLEKIAGHMLPSIQFALIKQNNFNSENAYFLDEPSYTEYFSM